MIKAVLFDFDGTIVDSLSQIHASWEAAFYRLGKQLSHQEIMDMYYTSKTKIKESHGVDPDKLINHFHEIFDQAIQDVEEQEHVFEVLAALKKRQVKTAIISFGLGERIKNFLRRKGLDQHFDLVLGREDVTEQKPHPKIALKAIAAFGVKPEETILVGDASVDIQTGKNAGVMTAFYHPDNNRLYTDMELFRDLEADFDFNHYSEFLPKLERFL